MNVRLVPVALLASALLMGLASSAVAAPTRAPLGPQVTVGPTPTLHPSGRDRYVEPGGSGTQGKAASDPDGAYNYGIDQYPGAGDAVPGGGLYTVDQDGNNGCGNDQDFEDDNNGRCGRAVAPCAAIDPSTGLMIAARPGNRHVVACPIESPTDSSPAQTGTSSQSDWSLSSLFSW